MWSIVYDISNRASFEELEWWFVERSRFAPESAVRVIVGNKADKVIPHLCQRLCTCSQWDPQEDMRQVPTKEAAAYAARKGALFVEASSKTAVGVREVFRDTVEHVLEAPIPA
jgi:Ras-related protein Rab-18